MFAVVSVRLIAKSPVPVAISNIFIALRSRKAFIWGGGIIAAFELGRRRMKLDEEKAICIQKSSDAFNFIHSRLIDLAHEEMWVIMLNRANKLISAELISKGGIHATCLDSRILFNKD